MKTLAAALALALSASAASAATVNLNSMTNTKTPGAGEVLTLGPGEYVVTPIDGRDDNGFIAWNAWSNNPVENCDADGANCRKGWLTNYAYRIGGLDPVLKSSGVFATPQKALDNAKIATFTLTATETVEFFISDSNYGDNDGGVSLRVSQVPVPAAAGLLVAALGGLGIARRRRGRDRARSARRARPQAVSFGSKGQAVRFSTPSSVTST